MFELNNHFVFHRASAIDNRYSSFIKLIHDFLASDNNVSSPVYIFLVVSVHGVNSRQMVSALCFSVPAEGRRAGPIPVQLWSLWALMSNTQIRLHDQ